MKKKFNVSPDTGAGVGKYNIDSNFSNWDHTIRKEIQSACGDSCLCNQS